MPEGDTIARTATNLRLAVQGKVVTRIDWHNRHGAVDSLAGCRVTDVQSRGKHLLIFFDRRRVLHSHLGMTGAWHIYPVGEPWRKPARRAAAAVYLEQVVAVCFSPKTLELLSAESLERHCHLQKLGPDLLGRELENDEILRRFRVHNGRPIGEALMNQTIVCGIGNVYKSETLFVTGIDPFGCVADSNDETLLRIVATASNLMKRNLNGYPRRTRFAGDSHRKWVYGRQGEPCFRCGEVIRMRRQGELGRSTYWCPRCQKKDEDPR